MFLEELAGVVAEALVERVELALGRVIDAHLEATGVGGGVADGGSEQQSDEGEDEFHVCGGRWLQRCDKEYSGLLEVVNGDFDPIRFALVHELQVLRMHLIVVLRLLAGEDEI